MPRRGHVVEDGGAFPARGAQDAAVPARDDVAARPRVGLLDVARSENLLVLQEHDTRAIAPALVRPYAREDVVDGIDDVLVSVVAELPVRALRGVAADRQRGVDQEIEPVDRLLDARTALCPDRPGVIPRGEHALHGIGDTRERRPRRRRPEVIGPVRKEVAPAHLGGDVALADVGPELRREPLRVAGRRYHTVAVDLRAPGDQVADPLLPDPEPS